MKNNILGAVLLACSSWACAASFSYSGSAVPIYPGLGDGLPGPPAEAPIPVSGLTQPVSKVTLSIDGDSCSSDEGSTTVGIDHPSVGDLNILLRTPEGNIVLVFTRAGTTGNNFCQVVLDDSAGPSIQSISSSQAPFTGSYKPYLPLSAFAGEPANGTWALVVQHFGRGEFPVGSIRAWTINITEMQAQAITFTSAAPVGAVVGGSPYAVTATGGGSNNPVVFSIDSSASAVCSISGSDVTFLAPGACVINANQAGNDEYSAAPQVQQTFQVAAVPVPKPITAVPTLGEWSLILLAAMAGALGLRARRKA